MSAPYDNSQKAVPTAPQNLPNGPAPSYGFQQPPPAYGPPPTYTPPGQVPPGHPGQGYPVQGPPVVNAQPGYTTVVLDQGVPHQTVIIGGCPACQAGVLQDTYSCLAIFVAIFFFPIGVLCCLAMREKQCLRCGARF